MTHEEQIETLEVENRMLRARCERLEKELKEYWDRRAQEIFAVELDHDERGMLCGIPKTKAKPEK